MIRSIKIAEYPSLPPSRPPARSHGEMINIFLALGLGLMTSSSSLGVTDPPAGGAATAVLRREAEALEPLVAFKLARDFLKATRSLPAVAPRKLFLDEAKKTYMTESAAGSLG